MLHCTLGLRKAVKFRTIKMFVGYLEAFVRRCLTSLGTAPINVWIYFDFISKCLTNTLLAPHLPWPRLRGKIFGYHKGPYLHEGHRSRWQLVPHYQATKVRAAALLKTMINTKFLILDYSPFIITQYLKMYSLTANIWQTFTLQNL